MNENQLDSVLIGKVISRARRSKGASQEVLSGLADISRTHLSAIERGKRKPTLETFWRISVALGIRPHDLLSQIEAETGGKDSASR